MIITNVFDVILIVILSTLSGYSIFLLIKSFIESILVSKFGFIKVKFFTKNYRIIEKLIRPKEGKVRIGSNDLPFNNSPGYIYLNSNTPYAFYKEGEINQINIEEMNKTNVDPELFSKLCLSYYEAGRLSALRKNNIQDILMILIIISVCVMIVGFFYLGYKLNALDTIKEMIYNMVNKLG